MFSITFRPFLPLAQTIVWTMYQLVACPCCWRSVPSWCCINTVIGLPWECQEEVDLQEIAWVLWLATPSGHSYFCSLKVPGWYKLCSGSFARVLSPVFNIWRSFHQQGSALLKPVGSRSACWSTWCAWSTFPTGWGDFIWVYPKPPRGWNENEWDVSPLWSSRSQNSENSSRTESRNSKIPKGIRWEQLRMPRWCWKQLIRPIWRSTWRLVHLASSICLGRKEQATLPQVNTSTSTTCQYQSADGLTVSCREAKGVLKHRVFSSGFRTPREVFWTPRWTGFGFWAPARADTSENRCLPAWSEWTHLPQLCKVG